MFASFDGKEASIIIRKISRVRQQGANLEEIDDALDQAQAFIKELVQKGKVNNKLRCRGKKTTL